MASLALTFNDVNFSPVQHNNQIWLSASELAKALGYEKSNAVTQIYERNKDEFAGDMTTTLKVSVVNSARSVENLNLRFSKKDANLEKTIRVFNSRGCHLITFFARTAVAKQFRKWVLDVLDKHIGAPVAKTHKSERTPLHDAHALLVAKTKHLNSSDAWKIINQRFGTHSTDEIPYDQIPVAVEYVHHLIALYSNADRKQFSDADKQNIHALASHMIWVMEWWRVFGGAIRTISPTMASSVHHHFVDGSCIAWRYIDKLKQDDLRVAVTNHEWLLSYSERRYMKS
ncbi:BRO family protein [Acinetobacter sp. TUM15509]|uniref:BRO-N domain-containing protein n=1 Tax=Acinetobacter sp. TUM15509 TaxID=2609154 RepID=UPI00125D14B2|nr:BRO family protein [Acinetobacter sp. TUM15509]